MTEQNDPLAPLKGRGHIVVGMGERLPCEGRWIGGLRGDIGPVFADVAGVLEELNAVAHAINIALSADALLAERDATIARLTERVAALEETGAAVVKALARTCIGFGSPIETARMIEESMTRWQELTEQAASGGEGGE